MTTRLDLVLQKYPNHEAGIRLLESNDPSGNLKYLDWGARILASGQALAPEVANVIELFHRFNGRQLHVSERVSPDIYSYRPQDFAKLRATLVKVKRSTERKRRARERLYRIEGPVEADVVYDSVDLVVRHIKNKNASVHYGHATKWCISMLREGHFEDYEIHNATFFFFERKAPIGDEFDKVALVIYRNTETPTTAFTSTDRQVDIMALARVYGTHVFDIFRQVYKHSDRYPDSVMFCVYSGVATEKQIKTAFSNIGSLDPYETDSLLEAICCNDAAPQSLLEEILLRASEMSTAAWKRSRWHGRSRNLITDLIRILESALFIHPAITDELREKLGKSLRRRHVDLRLIRRTNSGGRVVVSYQTPIRGRRHHRRRALTLTQLRARAKTYGRLVIQIQKAIEKAEKKKAKNRPSEKRTVTTSTEG